MTNTGEPDWTELSRRAALASHRLIGWIFWDPTAIANYAALGVPNGMGYYIASRAAPLAAAGDGAVTAAFGSIHADFVRMALNLCRQHTTFSAATAARDAAVGDGLRAHVLEIVDGLAELAPELWGAADRLPAAGRVLYAAHRDWPRPADPAVSAWLAVNCIREWRGDTHWAMQVAEGLSSTASGVLDGAWRSYQDDWLPRSRGADDAALADAYRELEQRGLATDGRVDHRGVAYRQHLEDRLDQLTALPWQLLGHERTVRLLDLVEAVGQRLVERIDATAGPNWMPAARTRPSIVADGHHHQHGHQQQHQHQHQGGEHHHLFDTAEAAERAELEGEVLSEVVTGAIGEIVTIAAQYRIDVQHILDLGCGPGVATCLLAGAFADADISAVDGSAVMLDRVAARSAGLGLTGRIHTSRVEFPAGLDTLQPADVIWASMVLHHLGDERAALAQLRRLTRPGGLLALVEHLAPVRVVANDDLGRPGLWERLDTAWAAWFTDMRATLPGSVPSQDYAAALVEAGFELLADQLLDVSLEAPLDDAARHFALRQLQGASQRLAPYADADDLAALEPLLAEDSPAGILHRADAVVRTSRHLYVGRATRR